MNAIYVTSLRTFKNLKTSFLYRRDIT